MVKSKVLIALSDLCVGGIQTSAVNFVNYLSKKMKDELDITLFVICKNGGLEKRLKPNIRIVEACKKMKVFGVSQGNAKSFGIKFALKRTITALVCKIFGNKTILQRCIKKQPFIGEFDIAISFAPSVGQKTMTVGCAEIVLNKTKAKKKFIFIHSDVSKINLIEPYFLETVSKFDKILCVSKSSCEIFKKVLHQFANKTDFLYNIQNEEDILRLRKEDCSMICSGVTFVSVSRLSQEKAFDRSLSVFKKLKEDGLEFTWNIIGSGPKKLEIEKYIKENKLEGFIHLYGNQINPYPYIKKADCLFLGSYHECAPMVYGESMIVGTPVLTTKTASAEELVGELGFICENNEDDIYEAIKDVIKNKEQLIAKKLLLKNYKSTNLQTITKFKEFIK